MTTTPTDQSVQSDWLERETRAAIKEAKGWPRWMLDAARFEPFGRTDDD